MTISPYDTAAAESGDIEAPLTNVHSEYVPQKGIHFYHFTMSFYSQLARLALEECNVRWTSHPVAIVAYEQYDPSYVRINPRCVVPTLVIDGRVTTDAFNICRLVDETYGGGSLTPDDQDEMESMETFSSLFKGIFVEALSYGDVPDFKRPFVLRFLGKKNHSAKAPILKKLVEQHHDDPFLKEAYEKKLAILQFTESSMRSAKEMKALMATIYAAMDKLEHQLEVGPFGKGAWLCSRTYSQADLEWSVMLRRFDVLNLGKKLLATRPHTARYQRALFDRPAFKRGINDWEHPLRQILIPVMWKKLTHRLGKV